jgi:hypothetical protein
MTVRQRTSWTRELLDDVATRAVRFKGQLERDHALRLRVRVARLDRRAEGAEPRPLARHQPFAPPPAVLSHAAPQARASSRTRRM